MATLPEYSCQQVSLLWQRNIEIGIVIEIEIAIGITHWTKTWCSYRTVPRRIIAEKFMIRRHRREHIAVEKLTDKPICIISIAEKLVVNLTVICASAMLFSMTSLLQTGFENEEQLDVVLAQPYPELGALLKQEEIHESLYLQSHPLGPRMVP